MKSRVGLVDLALESIFWTGVLRNAAARVPELELFGWPADVRKYDLLFGRQGLCGVELLGSVSQGELAGDTLAFLGRRSGASFCVAAAEDLDEHLQASLGDGVLRQEVCGVLVPIDLSKIDFSSADCLLDPQGLGVKVANLAQTLALADPNRRRRIGPDAQRDIEAKVFEHGLIAKTLP